MEAKYYIKKEHSNSVQCLLCPHNCTIQDGNSGICKVRTNNNGILISDNYNIVSSMGFDPIEKKPLYHYYPGAVILSVGSLGCNLQCKFCQNWQISQTSVRESNRMFEKINPGKIVELALTNKKNIGIAYTYNEPTVFYEYMIDTAEKANKENLKNVMVTNGFINIEPLDRLNKVMDAYSVDLKAYNDKFYIEYTKSRLDPVKQALLNMVKAEKHVEITNLVIPGLNDDLDEFEQMVKWIKVNLGKNIVLHISKYYPTYKLNIEPTPVEKMLELHAIAKQYLNHVFLGNVMLSEGNSTQCPKCNEILISRTGYYTKRESISPEGKCLKCGEHVLKYLN